MDRVYLPPECFAADTVSVEGPARHHLADSLRVRVGDTFLATDGLGREYLLEAERVDRRTLAANVREVRELPAHPGERVTLAIAPPKGTRMETAVEKATECGVGGILPLRTKHSVVKTGDGSERIERWRRVAQSATGQSGRARLPELGAPVPFDEAIAAAGTRLIAHAAEDSVPVEQAAAAAPAGEPITVFVGPEGGFSESELDLARRAGAIAVSLGRTRLRTETAAIVAVARIVAALEAAG